MAHFQGQGAAPETRPRGDPGSVGGEYDLLNNRKKER